MLHTLHTLQCRLSHPGSSPSTSHQGVRLMPTRLVRDGLLDSEAVLSLPPEGRWLFVAILLSADDYGLFEATPFKLAKRAAIGPEQVPQLLQAMAEVDLVRLYQAEGSKHRSFGFLPRFGQRMRGYRAKHPVPPPEVLGDDSAALSKFNDLSAKKTDHSQPTVRPPAGHGRPETEAEAETDVLPLIPNATAAALLVASAGAAATRKPGRRKSAAPPCPTQDLVALWNTHCAPPLPGVGVLNAARREAISARWREVCADAGLDQAAGLEWFGWLMRERVAGSDFLMGRRGGTHGPNGHAWQATLDWVFRPTNFAKVVDGNYINQGQP